MEHKILDENCTTYFNRAVIVQYNISRTNKKNHICVLYSLTLIQNTSDFAVFQTAHRIGEFVFREREVVCLL